MYFAAYVSAQFMVVFCFFFNDTATTEIYTLSLHDALPILLASVMLALSPAVAEAQTEGRNTSSVVVRPGDSLWSISEEWLGPNATPQQIYNETARIYALNSERIEIGRASCRERV